MKVSFQEHIFFISIKDFMLSNKIPEACVFLIFVDEHRKTFLMPDTQTTFYNIADT